MRCFRLQYPPNGANPFRYSGSTLRIIQDSTKAIFGTWRDCRGAGERPVTLNTVIYELPRGSPEGLLVRSLHRGNGARVETKISCKKSGIERAIVVEGDAVCAKHIQPIDRVRSHMASPARPVGSTLLCADDVKRAMRLISRVSSGQGGHAAPCMSLTSIRRSSRGSW